MTTSSDEIERKYARLSVDQKKYQRYSGLGAFCYIIVFFIGFALLLLLLANFGLLDETTQNGEPTSDVEINLTQYWIHLLISGLVVGVVGRFFIKKSKGLSLTEKEEIGVMIYDVYKPINDFIDSNLKEEHRKAAKKKLDKLIYNISQWKGNAPTGLYDKIDELTKEMKDRLVQIIQNSKNMQEIYNVRTFLHTFLASVDDAGINWTTIDLVLYQLKLIIAPTPQEALKLSRPILQQYPNLKFIVIAVLLGFAAFFAMRFVGAETYFVLAAAITTIVGLIAGLPHVFKKI